ncbi:MAG: hypothetical protein RMA76_31355 [Deltaproteobacteria bacterium]
MLEHPTGAAASPRPLGTSPASPLTGGRGLEHPAGSAASPRPLGTSPASPLTGGRGLEHPTGAAASPRPLGTSPASPLAGGRGLELHLTLDVPSEVDDARLRAWQDDRQLQRTHVVLGDAGSHVLLTAHGRWSLDEALRQARSHAETLRDAFGVGVSRTKIEAHLDAEGGLYIEHHLKVRFRAQRLGDVRGVAAATGAHLSRTASAREGDFEARFLTQRFDAHARDAADAALATLTDALHAAGLDITKVVRERALYDDNVALDDDWIGGTP